jgi:hypothetical protein
MRSEAATQMNCYSESGGSQYGCQACGQLTWNALRYMELAEGIEPTTL